MQGVGYRAADSLVAVLGGPRSSTPEFINWIYGLQMQTPVDQHAVMLRKRTDLKVSFQCREVHTTVLQRVS